MIAFHTSVLLAAVVGNTELSVEEKTRAAEVYHYAFERKPPNGLDPSRIQNLPEEDRDLVIRWLRAQGGASSARAGKDEIVQGVRKRSATASNLAILGDAWGLQDFAEEFRERPRAEWGYRFKNVRNAKLIPMVGDLLFRTEKYEWSYDLGFPPTQWTAARGIVETLKYAPQFQPDVWQWGQELDDAWSKPGGDVINILREWYRENEEKLRAGKFDEVRAGRHPVVESTTEPPVPTPVPSASSSVRETASTARLSEKSEERTPFVGASFWGYVGGAIGCVALLGALWLWTRRSAT